MYWVAGQARTDDLRNHNPLLYHLSYNYHVKKCPCFPTNEDALQGFRTKVLRASQVIYGLILDSERRFTQTFVRNGAQADICSPSGTRTPLQWLRTIRSTSKLKGYGQERGSQALSRTSLHHVGCSIVLLGVVSRYCTRPSPTSMTFRFGFPQLLSLERPLITGTCFSCILFVSYLAGGPSGIRTQDPPP